VAGDTTTSAAGFLKQKFSNFLGDDQQHASDLWMMIEKQAGTEEAGGLNQNVKWAHAQYAGVGMKGLSEGGDYPTAQPAKAINPTLGLAHWAFAVDFTGHLSAAGSSSDVSWAGDWQRKLGKDLRDRQRSLTARFACHDGTANWGQIVAVSGTTNGYMTITGVPIHFFHPGEVVTIRDSASSGTEQLTNAATGAGKIVEIDYANSRVYLADMTGAAADDYIALSGFYDVTVPNGIKNIIDSAGTIQGIARGTVGNFMYQATEQTTTAALSPSDVDLLRDTVQDIASLRKGKYKSQWVGNRKMRRWATLATAGQSRFVDLDLTMGVAEMKIQDRDGRAGLIEDPYILDGELYVASFGKWVKAYPKKLKGGYPVLNNGSPLWKANAASGSGKADRDILYWACRMNLGCRDFRCQAKRTGITSP